MMDTTPSILAVLWAGGLAATPVALIVGGICRWKGLRPATRHMLWLAVLASFVTPAIGMWAWRPEWSRSERLIAAADTVIDTLGPRPVAGPTVSPERRSEAPTFNEPVKIADAPKVEHRVPDAGTAGDGNTVAPGAGRRATPALIGLAMNDGRERAHARASRSGPARTTRPEPTAQGRFVDDRGAMSAPSAAVASRAAEEMKIVEPIAAPVSEPAPAPALAPAPASFIADERPQPSAGEAPTVQEPAALADSSAGADDRAAVKRTNGWHEVRGWVTGAVALRDAIAELPPVPVAVWLGGALILVAVRGASTVNALRVLRRSRPAGADIRALVRAVAADLELRRVPEVVVVDSAVSPMIWCGLVPRLVLPLTLWRALDDDSRRAVVVHELAHLKRKDHVLCWVESVIGAAYWWHPVAWWARRKLRDEAEACCDAWVTSLLPSSRRAYASALLTTKSYLSGVEKGRGPSGEGPWLGVMSGSAKKLARRITMVMTQRTAPRVSMVGACVAVLVVAVGTFVTPTLACPPEEGQKKASAPAAVIIKRGEKARSTTPRADAAPAVTFFGEGPALEAMKGGQNPFGSAEAPAAVAGDPLGGQTSAGVWIVRPQEGQAAAPSAPQPARAPKAPRAPKPPRALMVPGQPSMAAPVDLESLKVGRTPRSYRLSDGKRDAFWSLMSRSDVPVLVEMQNDGVIVWASDDEHPVLEKFVKMIDPESKGARKMRMMAPAGVGLGGATPAVGALSMTSPSAMSPMRAMDPLGGLKAVPLKQYQESLRALELNRAKMEADAARAGEEAGRVREQYEKLAELTTELRQSAKAMSEKEAKSALEQTAAEMKVRSESLRQRSRSMDDRERMLQRQLEELERRTEELAEKLAELEDADDRSDQIDESDEVGLADGVFIEGIAMPELAEGLAIDADEIDATPEVIEVEGVDMAPEAMEVEGVEIAPEAVEGEGEGEGFEFAPGAMGNGAGEPCPDAPSDEEEDAEPAV